MTPDEFGPPEPVAPKTSAYQAFDVGTVRGVPVLGPLTTRGDAAADAAMDVLRGAISGPQSVAVAPASGMLEFLKNQYAAHLREREQADALLKAEHPTATKAGEIVGGIAGYAALPASTMASLPAAVATTGGISALDKAAQGGSAKEVAGAGVGGALGGAAGYGLGKVIGNVAGRLADRNFYKAAGATTKSARQELDNAISRIGPTQAGDLAALGRDLDIVGGIRSQGNVAEAAKTATTKLGEQLGAMMKEADATGVAVPVESVRAELMKAAEGLAPEGVGASIPARRILKQTMAAIEKRADSATGTISHQQLQEFLSAQHPSVAPIYRKMRIPYANISDSEAAKLAMYGAGRRAQDTALESALGQSAAPIRRTLTLTNTLEKVAESAEAGAKGSDAVGLLGKEDITHGGLVAMLGHPVVGGALALKGLLGKVTRPYRANILTSLYSGVQGGMERAGEAGIPAILGSRAGAGLGSSLMQPPGDEFGPPEPVPEIAKRGR